MMGLGLKRMLRRLTERHLPWDAHIAEVRQRIDRLETSASWEADIADLQARTARLEARCESLVEAQTSASRIAELTEKAFALEQLLTSSPAARPPGAAAAVKALGDPAVSVILPTYNRARFIGDAIRSVQAQSFRSWELLVVDDGSTDDTGLILEAFADDPRVKYIRKENGGSSLARNLGVERSTAPLIAYIDSDNVWYPDFLSIAVDDLAANPEHDFIYGALVSYLHLLESGCILWKKYNREELERGNFIDTNVFVHRRSLFARYGGWDPKLSALNDWDIALRYTADKPAYRVNALAAFYRKCDDIRATDLGSQDEETAWIRTKMAE
jgi:hypothetical protein